MALDNASYVGGLNPTIPTNNDPVTEGAGQIRAVKEALTNTFPNVNGIVDATADELNALTNQPNTFVQGMIMPFASATIPSGWALCDGSTVNGFVTPDLRGLFLKGYDERTSEQAGTVTGNTNNEVNVAQHLTVDEHVLGVTELPEHKHSYKDIYYPEDKAKLIDEGATTYEDLPPGYNGGVGSNSTDDDNNAVLYLERETDNEGGGQGHSHGISDSSAMNIQPEAYVIRYICYVGV